MHSISILSSFFGFNSMSISVFGISAFVCWYSFQLLSSLTLHCLTGTREVNLNFHLFATLSSCVFLFLFFFWRFLWEFSNAVWVAAVALFFHRWGKIRMLLPYQPVFKEEEPVIVGCSPSPTPLQLSQPSQLLPSSSLSQSQPPVPPSAVHVSANKFVSLDPAAIRRNQFMVS